MASFADFNLPKALNKTLAAIDFKEPTPIQAKAIPLALAGHDIMGSAQTGTGKTGAFAIPVINHLLNHDEGTALVLTPTRELGKQVMDMMQQLLGPRSPIRSAFIIGGAPMSKQIQALKAGPRLIVGTPGRINDHLIRGSLKLDDTRFLVLDETDRMLDMGFSVQLDRIAEFLPDERQTLMFSATLPQNILKMADRYLTDPQRIAVGSTTEVAKTIKQEVVRIEQNKKFPELLDQLEERDGTVIVFVKTKHGADRIAKNLTGDGFEAKALHGDLPQHKRDRVMRQYRDKQFRILIATDIAARGLDVPHIEHVINYDLPQVAEDFIHRMGRTGRAGAEGSALSFVASQDGKKWRAIEKLLGLKSTDDKGGRPRSAGKGRGPRETPKARKHRARAHFEDRQKRREGPDRSEGEARGERKSQNDWKARKRRDDRDMPDDTKAPPAKAKKPRPNAKPKQNTAAKRANRKKTKSNARGSWAA